MTRLEKINKIIEAQIKVENNIVIDEDLFNNLYNQMNLIYMNHEELLVACQEYQKAIKKYNNKQAEHIKTLTDDNLINYCLYNNLKPYNHNIKLQIDRILIAKTHRKQFYDATYQTTIQILKNNKKILNNNLKELFNKQTFIQLCNENLINTLYKQLKYQYNQYVYSLENKYYNMKDEELNNLYTHYIVLNELM